jgi:DNA-binding transcriptional LysR family regulator
MEDRMVLIAGRRSVWPGKPWSGKSPSGTPSIPLSALSQVPLLMRERGSGSRRVVEQALRRAGLTRKDLRIAMDLDSIPGIVSAVEAGLGAGFVSAFAVQKELRLGTVRVVGVEGLDIRRDFSLIRGFGPVPDGPAGAFERFVLAQGSWPMQPDSRGRR